MHPIPPLKPLPHPLDPSPHPTPLPLHPCPILLPKHLPHPFALGHLVALGPLIFPNLNIAAIWIRDTWLSIQINFWGSLLPTKEVLHTCKIINYFNQQYTFGHFAAVGPLTFPNLNISTSHIFKSIVTHFRKDIEYEQVRK